MTWGKITEFCLLGNAEGAGLVPVKDFSLKFQEKVPADKDSDLRDASDDGNVLPLYPL